MNTEFPTTKRALRKHLSTTAPRESKPVTNFQALRDDTEVRDRLTAKLEVELTDLEIDDMNVLNEYITSTVRASMDEVCPKSDPVKKKQPWEDAELIQQMKDLRKRSKHQDVRNLQKAVKKRRNKLKNDYYREMADSINNAATEREVNK